MINKTEALQIELGERLKKLKRTDVAKRSGMHINTIHRVANVTNCSVTALGRVEDAIIELEAELPMGENRVAILAREHGLSENDLRVKITKNDMLRRSHNLSELNPEIAAIEAASQLVLARA